MIGNQENKGGFDFGVEYKTLDPDGGFWRFDLNDPVPQEMNGRFKTVFNLGTLEHVWNIHQAFVNAAAMLMPGGYYLHHSPVAGYEYHGIHVTDFAFILEFFKINDYRIIDYWFSDQLGNFHMGPYRDCGQSLIFWMIAKKLDDPGYYKYPQQVFKWGTKQ